MTSSCRIPIVRWADSKKAVCITVDVIDPQGASVALRENEIDISCSSSMEDGSEKAIQYQVTLPLFDKVKVSESRYAVARNIVIRLEKEKAERWSSLYKNGEKKSWIKPDWSRWIDSDDEDDSKLGNAANNDFDFGGMDMSNFGGMGGMGGLGGMGDMPDFGGMGDMPEDEEDDADDADEAEDDEDWNKAEEEETAACCSHKEEKEASTATPESSAATGDDDLPTAAPVQPTA